MHAFVILLAGGLALAACAESEPVDETEPTPAEALPVDVGEPRVAAPAPTSATEGGPALAQGQWFARTERGMPAALFGPPESEVLFSVRCEGDELAFGVGVGEASGPATMEVAADGKTRSVAATAQQDPIPQATGRIPADDPFAAVLAKATGPVAITIEGDPALRVPAHPTMRKVVSDCSN